MARTPTSELVATIEEVRRTRGILADLVRAMEEVVRRVDKLTLNLERLERRAAETLGRGEMEPIGVEDLGRLGINGANQLFWDGKRVELRQELRLTGFQKVVTGLVTLCAVLGAVGGFVTRFNNASVFLCARDVHWLSCPAAR